MRIDFDAKTVDGDIIESSDIVSSVKADDTLLKVGNVYFVELSDATITTSVTVGSDADFTYAFDNYVRNDYANTHYTNPVTNRECDRTAISNTADLMFFPYNDMTITAVFTEREYEVVISPSNSAYITASTINGEAVNSKVLKFNDAVALGVTPKSGYKVSEWSALGDAVVADADVNNATFSIADYVAAVYASQTEKDISQIVQLVANVDLVAEEYIVHFGTNRADCDGAGLLKVAIEGVTDLQDVVDGSKVAYNDTVYLVIDSTKIATNYKFSNWQIQVVANAATPSEDAWTDIELIREDSVDFVIPDCNDGEEIYFRAVFTKITYTISLGAVLDECGNIYLVDEQGAALSSNEFAYDSPVFVKIEANTGYHFDTIVVDGTDYTLTQDADFGLAGAEWIAQKSTIKFDNLSKNTTFDVVFVKNTYNVTVRLSVTNAASTTTTVTNANGGASVLGQTPLLYKDVLSFEVNLEDGFELSAILVNGEPLNLATAIYNVQAMGSTDVEIVVQKKSFAVSVRFGYVDENGDEAEYDYVADDSCIEGAGNYLYHTTTQVSVNLPEMFVIAQWVLNGENIENDNNYLVLANIRANQDVVVLLKIKQSTISFGQIGDTGSSAWYSIYYDNVAHEYLANIESLQRNYGDTVELNINDQYFTKNGRNSKFVFAFWQINGTSVSDDRYLVVTANGKDILVEAVFRPAQVSVVADVYLYNNATHDLVATEAAGRINGLGSTAFSYGESRSAIAIANDGYKFIEWRDVNGELLTSNSVYSFTVSSPVEIMAIFVKLQKVTVNNDSTKGSVEGAGDYIVGDLIRLNVTPAKGYRFVAWKENGQVISTDEELTIGIPYHDLVLDVEYEAVYVVNYKVNDSGLGTVVGNTTGKFKENVTLEAISANNSTFVGWVIDDVIVSTSAKLNISLNGDVEVEALFKKNFDWNIVIVLVGCGIFVIVMICGVIAFIKSKEAQPIGARSLIGGKDDKDVITKASKRVAKRDEIAPVPTRKESKANVQPVPVRKIVVAPSDHKGNKVTKSTKAKDKSATLSTDSKN